MAKLEILLNIIKLQRFNVPCADSEIWCFLYFQGCKSSMLTGQNVREIVKCKSCSKPRCIYSNPNVSNREQRELRKIIRTYEYLRGCLITPDVCFLSGTLFTRLKMHCKSPIEWACYSPTKANARKNVCCHCSKISAKVDSDEKKLYKSVLPACNQRKAQGKKILKREPIQTAKANKQRARHTKNHWQIYL